MTANKEDGLKLVGMTEETRECLGVFPQRWFVYKEVLGLGIVFWGINGAWVERGFAAIGRRDDNLDVRCQDLVRMYQLRLEFP